MKPSGRLSVACAVVLLSLANAPGAIYADIINTAQVTAQDVRLPEGVPEIDQAIEQFKKRDYDQCLALLKSAVASHPELVSARLLFAKLCLGMEQPARGRSALEQVVVENPKLPEPYLIFGRLALQDNRLTDAQLQFEKAAALMPSDAGNDRKTQALRAELYGGLATTAEHRKDWPVASANLSSWLQLEPKNGQARQRLSAALFRQGQREKAGTELEKAAKDDPALLPAAILMGRLYAEEGNAKKAAEWMEYAIKVAPNDAKAHLGYAAWLLDYDQPDPARVQAETASKLDPTSKDAKRLQGLIAWHVKDYQAAERIFQDLHLENPGNLTTNNLWVLSLTEQPSEAQRNRAWQVAQINARLDPNSAETLTALGRAAYRVGKLDQAEQSLRAAITTGKGSSETAYYLAQVLADVKKPEEAARCLKASLDAPGAFAFRTEARAWLDRLQKPNDRGTESAKAKGSDAPAK
jgi:tetratricopeptide (TPR) repeat protein